MGVPPSLCSAGDNQAQSSVLLVLSVSLHVIPRFKMRTFLIVAILAVCCMLYVEGANRKGGRKGGSGTPRWSVYGGCDGEKMCKKDLNSCVKVKFTRNTYDCVKSCKPCSYDK